MKKTLFLLTALSCGMILSVGCGGPQISNQTQEEVEAEMDDAMNMDAMGEAEASDAAGDGGDAAGAGEGGDAAATEGGDEAAP